MSSVSERIEYLLKENGVATREVRRKLSEICGISYQAVSQWFNGATKNIESAHLANIAKEYGASLEWLITGNEPEETFPRPDSNEDRVIIPFYDARASCGGGYANEEYPELLKGRTFDKPWLKKRGLQHQYLMLIRASGDSMSPTITHGSALLVNKSIDNVLSGKIYLINDGEGERVKRLFREPTGNWRIASDNPNKNVFPDFTVTDEQMKKIKVVGRVVWHDEDL